MSSTPGVDTPKKQLRSRYSLGFIASVWRKASPNLRVLWPPTHFSSILRITSGTHQAPFSAIEYLSVGVPLEDARPDQHVQRSRRPPAGLARVDREHAVAHAVVGRAGARVGVEHEAELLDEREERVVVGLVVGGPVEPAGRDEDRRGGRGPWPRAPARARGPCRG